MVTLVLGPAVSIPVESETEPVGTKLEPVGTEPVESEEAVVGGLPVYPNWEHKYALFF